MKNSKLQYSGIITSIILLTLTTGGVALAQQEEPQPSQAATETSPSANTSESESEAPTDDAPIVEEKEGTSVPAPTQQVGTETDADATGRKEVSGEAKKNEPTPYTGPGTLLGGDDQKMVIGGYGGLTMLATGLENQAAMLIGGEGGLLLDHRFVLGLGGYGLASLVEAQPYENGDRAMLMFGYGGPILRYQFIGKGPLSLSVGALLGGGGIGFLRELSDQDWEVDEDFSTGHAFFVFEPSVQADVHLTRWMRLGADLRYRAIEGAKARDVDDSGLSGFAGGGHIQFGWF